MLAKIFKVCTKLGFAPSLVAFSFAAMAFGDAAVQIFGAPYRMGLPIAACALAAIAIDYPKRTQSAMLAIFATISFETMFLLPFVSNEEAFRITVSVVWFALAAGLVVFAIAPLIRHLQNKYPLGVSYATMRIERPKQNR